MDCMETLLAGRTFIDYLSSRGIAVRESVAYDDMAQIVSRAQKPYLTAYNSPAWHDFSEGNCTWTVGFMGDEPVVFGVARLEDLGREPLSSYWSRSYNRLYPTDAGRRIAAVAPSVDRVLTGRLAYFGDLFVGIKARRLQHARMAFVGLGHLCVSMKWSPDASYCMVTQRHAMRGAHLAYGFNNLLHSAVKWTEPPSQRSDTDCLAYIPKSELGGAISALSAMLPASSLSGDQGCIEKCRTFPVGVTDAD